MKFKPLSEYQILITLDRLTRFKPVQEKYTRVFKDIILQNLIKPKLKKNELDELNPADLKALATFVFNSTLESLGFKKQTDFSLNKKLAKYEDLIFILNDDEKVLLNNELWIDNALKLFNDDVVQNLRWLQFLDIHSLDEMYKLRSKYKLKYPLSCVVITEGITEEILLPKFSKLLGFDFDENGVKVLSAGGKNQSVKLFYSICPHLQLPIFVLFDNDAVENLDLIMPKLRKSDGYHLITRGEFEDILPEKLILDSINSEFRNLSQVKISDFNSEISMVKNLEDIFKQKGLHEFKKAEFATLLSQNVDESTVLTPEIRLIVEKIKKISTIAATKL